jgi:glycosyltransferase involved in cell wall biosynthesis
MNQNHLQVSVIIPVYNAECYVSAAIESVLAQSVLPLEIIVVDDSSTDGSGAAARRFVPNVRVVTQPNQGPAAARNCGVGLAQGDYLAFLDADDLWVSNKLQRQLHALAADPTLAMVFGQVEQFYSPELIQTAALPSLGDRHRLAGLHVGAMLIRRTAFARVGLFDTQWLAAEFIEWYGRAQALGVNSLVLPDLVMRRRIHTTNLGIRAHHLARREYLQLAKRRIEQHAGLVVT